MKLFPEQQKNQKGGSHYLIISYRWCLVFVPERVHRPTKKGFLFFSQEFGQCRVCPMTQGKLYHPPSGGGGSFITTPDSPRRDANPGEAYRRFWPLIASRLRLQMPPPRNLKF